MPAQQHIGRSALIVALAAAASGILACAAPVKPPPAPAPTAAAPAAPAAPVFTLRRTDPPGDLGAVERYAWLAVIQLGDAFASGDVDGFLARVSRGFYRGYPALESALRTLVADTTNRSVVVAVGAVALDGDRVSVRARWERILTRGDGVPQMLAGETTFHFLKSDTSLRLLDFQGDVPFGIEGIPAAP